MRKTVSFGAKPQTQTPPTPTADQWVSAANGTSEPEPAPAVPMKRLTIDIPESLHRTIKTQCASRGLRMADEIRTLLERHFVGIQEDGK